jgi:hypothetical protein
MNSNAPRFSFTIRDLLWATALASTLAGWWCDSRDRAAREKRDVEMLSFQEEYLQGSEDWLRMPDDEFERERMLVWLVERRDEVKRRWPPKNEIMDNQRRNKGYDE